MRANDIDNRDSGQMYEYFEARIDALKRRIAELEDEKVQRAAIAEPLRATGTLAFKVAHTCS
jgi:cell division protein FtsB